MSMREAEPLVFSRSFGGYNRGEVDDYFVKLNQFAEKLEDRAKAAESSLAECSSKLADARQQLAAAGGGELPGRLAQILALAQEEADEIRERARAEEGTITEQAARDAQQMLGKASEQRLEIEQQIRRLSTTREEFLNDLRSLGARIAEAAQYYDASTGSAELAQEHSPAFETEEVEPGITGPLPDADDADLTAQ